ncbi:hypothetical protein [Brevundimonas fluminis]|jgi:hypothetical protein|uniref:hypothetical protein n=1 Tax=Brevundimonas fluminis TaxID=2487274 RepID=UPI000F658BC9|nr:hypothetical protein [Brevundimonas fluminis]
MVRTALLGALLIGATPAAAQTVNSHCVALDALARDVATSAKPRTIRLFKLEPMEFACAWNEADPITRDYCGAALENMGIEFHHRYPWTVHDCLAERGIATQLVRTDAYTGLRGRNRIHRLSAVYSDLATIEITFVPEDDGSGGTFADYYGRFILKVLPLETGGD